MVDKMTEQPHQTPEAQPLEREDMDRVSEETEHAVNDLEHNTPITIKKDFKGEGYTFELCAYGFKERNDYSHFKNQASEKRVLPPPDSLIEKIKIKFEDVEAIKRFEKRKIDEKPQKLKELIESTISKHASYPHYKGFGICIYAYYELNTHTDIDWIIAFGTKSHPLPISIPVQDTMTISGQVVDVTGGTNNGGIPSDNFKIILLVYDENTKKYEDIKTEHWTCKIEKEGKFAFTKKYPILNARYAIFAIEEDYMPLEPKPRHSEAATHVETKFGNPQTPIIIAKGKTEYSGIIIPMVKKEAPEIRKAIAEIKLILEELKKLDPEHGDFWNKKEKIILMEKITANVKRITKVTNNKRIKEFEKYTYIYEKFIEKLKTVKGNEIAALPKDQKIGNVKKVIEGIEYIIKRIERGE